jgi:hypothetical protein
MSYPILDSPNLFPELEHPGQRAGPVIFGSANFTGGRVLDKNEVNGPLCVCQILAMVVVVLIHHIQGDSDD